MAAFGNSVEELQGNGVESRPSNLAWIAVGRLSALSRLRRALLARGGHCKCIVIRALVGLQEISAIYPLYQQTGSLPAQLFHKRLAAMLAQGNYRCIAAFVGEKMVGVAGFWTGTQLWAGKWVEADHVVVDAQTRSLGISATLIAWIEEEAVRLGCDIARISMVLGKERTHNFYGRNGYADDGLILVKPLSAWAEAEFPEYAAHKVAMERG